MAESTWPILMPSMRPRSSWPLSSLVASFMPSASAFSLMSFITAGMPLLADW